jgi:branched-chain amino acid transport system ATP-binding protein
VTSLQTSNVSVHFDGLSALEGVDLILKPGSVLGLVGPNGAGKTTLVNVMSGFQKPSRGELILNGRSVNSISPERLAALGVARTFQSVRLFRRLSVLDNVIVSSLTHHRRMSEARNAARSALEFLSLTSMARRRAGGLAYADERRVGMARALALRPKFLLLDEPAAGMDDAECDTLAELIARIPGEFDCGVLLIEHNISVVTSVCHELHVLNNGRTLASGQIDVVRKNPDVVAAYFGTT